MNTVRSLLSGLPAASTDGENPRRDAEILLQHALERDRAWLAAHDTDPLPPERVAFFHTLWTRRLAGEPVAYLTGRRGFWTLDLAVTPDVLIPRPETERLVEIALSRIPEDATWDVADLGTGSGAIALALARERPGCRILATDASPEALAMAMANAAANAVGNVGFRQGEWWEPLRSERFHLVVSNPPYVAAGDPHLTQGDLRFEPPAALIAGERGLDALRIIITDAPAHLHPGGTLLIEHGHDQADAVRALLRAAGFKDVETWRDLGENERVSGGWNSG